MLSLSHGHNLTNNNKSNNKTLILQWIINRLVNIYNIAESSYRFIYPIKKII